MKHTLSMLAIAALAVAPVLGQGGEVPITHELKLAINPSQPISDGIVAVQRGQDIAITLSSRLDAPARVLVLVSEATPQNDVDLEKAAVLLVRSFQGHQSSDFALTLSEDLPEIYVALRMIAITADGVILSSAPLGVKLR